MNDTPRFSDQFRLSMNLTPHVDASGKLIIESRSEDLIGEAQRSLTTWEFDAKEKIVRDYLVNLGWTPPAGEVAPVPMILFCPSCGTQHIDAPEPEYADNGADATEWHNPPHRSHLCHGCGIIWRPADVTTVGVAKIETRGKADTFDPSLTRPVGVPDGWQKIGFIELSALARLMQGSKKAETLFVSGGGCRPKDVYVKLAAAPEVPRG